MSPWRVCLAIGFYKNRKLYDIFSDRMIPVFPGRILKCALTEKGWFAGVGLNREKRLTMFKKQMFTGKLIKVVKTPAYCLFSMRLTFVCIKKSKISAGSNFFLKHVLMIFFNLIFLFRKLHSPALLYKNNEMLMLLCGNNFNKLIKLKLAVVSLFSCHVRNDGKKAKTKTKKQNKTKQNETELKVCT